MDAKEFLETLGRMKNEKTCSAGFALSNYNTYMAYNDYAGAVRCVERWGKANPRSTVYVPDEITLVTTLEVTKVLDKGWLDVMADGHEMDEAHIAEYKRQLENWVRNKWFSGSGADDVNILSVQQFITKGHEEKK